MQKEGFGSNKIITLVIAIIIVFVLALYFTFLYKSECGNLECFQSAMKSCSKKTYVNEVQEASWLYSVQGKEGSNCVIQVKLLQAKKGELGIDRLNGLSMDCAYPGGVFAYPEKDLAKCHGRLKEELQTIIIEKLHSYIIENLGRFDDALNQVV